MMCQIKSGPFSGSSGSSWLCLPAGIADPWSPDSHVSSRHPGTYRRAETPGERSRGGEIVRVA